ncbi:MAG TPA: thioredoxin domain-containing protein [Gemmatimonadales bacterium]|jgi:protein-disulfide isomerase|nr:thioredoxin domain-containing protein [Gemmatimonadales bacterium]
MIRRSLFLLLCVPLVSAAIVQDDPLASRAKGSASAPVTVYEMSDFQCPYCKRHVDQTFPALEKEYIATGKVRWVFINFPLSSIHPNAEAAAEFAMCAAREGKFWPAHDLLYRLQNSWAPLKNPTKFLHGLADSLKLPRTRLSSCLDKGETREEVRGDADGAVKAGAGSTPAFYIEGGLLTGALAPEVWRPILDSIYRVKTQKKP